MQYEIPLILISHGAFAQGALDCVEMLIGKQNNVSVLSVMQGNNFALIRDRLHKLYHEVNNNKGVIILTDLLGGTPCNIASELLTDYDDVLLYCGFNIPVLIEVLLSRNTTLSQVIDIIEKTYPYSCIHVTKNPNKLNILY
ncbi:PTS sugar transporter subunit IIA [Klebsiella aerogenes]|uniref:PTS sugar transporter subunit IIA n=1 Tax=Klebsiella aerogenes TaxID=548 RepID=UPI0032DB4ABF